MSLLLAPSLVAQLGRHQLVPRQRVRGRFQGAHRSARLGASVEFADVREYVAGDDPRRIDLSASRRHRRLQVTLTEAEDDAAAQVIVDRSASMRGVKAHTADQLAASLAVLGSRDGVRLWLSSNAAGSERLGGGWARGSAALGAAITLLGSGSERGPEGTRGGSDDPPAGRPDLAAAVRRAARTPAHGPLVLISDLLFDGWDGAIRALGSARRDALVLQVLARGELEPQLADDVRYVDVETGAEVEVGADERTREAYAETLAVHLAAVASACTSIGAAHLVVPDDADLTHVLLAELPALGLVR